MTVSVGRFDSEQELTDYLDSLNDLGLAPEVSTMDSAGFSTLCVLQAPGGDGWAVAYYGVTDPDTGSIVGECDSGWVQPLRSLGDRRDSRGWQPKWPVYGLVNHV
ncbi:hypothetical protein SEA_MORGANA_68 [Gordonia phage Morgana]|uniref:Minor tail protein n=1 Tax=Gordonia phage Morgana TaxID=3137292 RepID=A0AAX4RBR8_9CAUD